jgi:hypothetical protein
VAQFGVPQFWAAHFWVERFGIVQFWVMQPGVTRFWVAQRFQRCDWKASFSLTALAAEV